MLAPWKKSYDQPRKKVKENEVTQLCLALCDSMEGSLPGFSVHGIFQGFFQEYWSGCRFLLQGIFLTQGSNSGLPHCRQMLYHLSHQGSPFKRQNMISNHTGIIIHNSNCFPFPFASNLGVVQAAWSCGTAIGPCQSAN